MNARQIRLIDYALSFLAANADEQTAEELETESVESLVDEIHKLNHEINTNAP